jgi:hypothetical protein
MSCLVIRLSNWSRDRTARIPTIAITTNAPNEIHGHLFLNKFIFEGNEKKSNAALERLAHAT